MSVYKGDLTTQFVIESSAKLMKSFPALPKEFFEIFGDRIKDNEFNDSRLNDAVNYVIDNCVYPTPTIAQFISFDRNVKLYSYDDMIKKTNENKKAFEIYKSVKVKNLPKPMWASINDIQKYNLELYNNEK